MPNTRDPCPDVGMYRSLCCKAVVAPAPGFYFPSCFVCGQHGEWVPHSGEDTSDETART